MFKYGDKVYYPTGTVKHNPTWENKPFMFLEYSGNSCRVQLIMETDGYPVGYIASLGASKLKKWIKKSHLPGWW